MEVLTLFMWKTVVDLLSNGVPAVLNELLTLGRTLKRAADALAYFDCPGISNGPTKSSMGCVLSLTCWPPFHQAPYPDEGNAQRSASRSSSDLITEGNCNGT